MKKHLYLIFAVLSIVLISNSCVTQRQTLVHQYPRGLQPELWIEYHPYPDLSGLTSDLRPVPMYEGWTDERMVRDLKRMHFSGFRGILIFIRPQDIAREHVRSRCRQFYKLSQESFPDFRLGIVFTAGMGDDQKLSMPLQNVMNFFQHQKFGEFSNAIRLNQQPVLFLDSNILTSGAYSGRYTYRRFGKEWPVHSPWGKVPAADNHDRFTWVTSAYNGGLKFSRPGLFQKWILPRASGASLFKGIQEAAGQQAAIICVHSWNNYEDGSFIEENTYDTTSMLWTMKHIHDDLNGMAPAKQ